MSIAIICPFTGIGVDNYTRIDDEKERLGIYRVTTKSKGASPDLSDNTTMDVFQYTYKIPDSAITEKAWEEDAWFRKNRHLIGAAMYNGLSLFNEDEVIDLPLIKLRLASSVIPHTPKMKLDHLLKYIADQLNSPGETLEIELNDREHRFLLVELYLVNTEELHFYASTLDAEGLVKTERSGGLLSIRLTFQGLSYLASLEDAGALSKNCFVAMSFDESRKKYRAAIIQAITECGYNPVIVDDRNIDSDKTINDQIIADIRRCKFCISDFTLQRNGVYFEAGFALGLGKPVIYVCEKKDFENSHFDLKPFQHFLYESAEELQTGLVRKIQAWIQ